MTRSSPPPPAHAALPSPCPDATRRPDTVRDKFVGEFVGHLGAAIHPGGGGGGGRGGPGEKCFMNSSLSNSSVPAGGGGGAGGGEFRVQELEGRLGRNVGGGEEGGEGYLALPHWLSQMRAKLEKGLPSPSLVFPGVCVCVCVCVCVYILPPPHPYTSPPSWSEGCSALRYTHAHIHLHTHTHTHIPRTLATPRPLLVFPGIFVRMCIRMYVCMYIRMHACKHVFVYIHESHM
jgi:hypothetical protein